jgi:hypothetical protein
VIKIGALPIITEKYNIPLFHGTIGSKQITENEPNGYYEKILSGTEDENCLELMCYDTCVNAVEQFFENIEECRYDFAFANVDISIKKAKKVAAMLKEFLLDYIASERNDFGISMIENMDESTYKENYKNIFGKYPDE